jgi:hypothetical protein
MALLMIFLRRKLSRIDGKTILNSTIRIIAASLVGGGVAQIAKIIVGTQDELDTFLAVLVQFTLAGLSGISAFLLASYYLNIPEFFQFKHSITRKLFGAKKDIQEDTGEVTGI